MKVIKRDGREVEYDRNKIAIAIEKANEGVDPGERIYNIVASIESRGLKTMHVEDIQDIIEQKIMAERKFALAKAYIKYRYTRELVRKANTTDDSIMSLIKNSNKDVMEENSNKNAIVASTQRDLIAGEVSKDLTKRVLLPEKISKAHEQGVLHFHDADYFLQSIFNCCLINIGDMLDNGTVMNGKLIESPKSFQVACTVMTQIISAVASSQYGGQSISLTHLAPFVQTSREKIRRDLEKEIELLETKPDEKTISEIVEKRIRDEIKRGVQTIQYQVVTLMTTNGQAPFVTVFMYLGEAKNEQEKKDLAIIIEEVLRQRIKGVKNEAGVYITPAFPKLIYVLEEQNIHENSPYYYLTELAAECTAKRMVPDYISEKIMLKLKVDSNGNGNCYTCMGCRSFLTPYVDEKGAPKYYGRFNQGVVTINLVDIALSAGGEEDKFWKIFDDRLELCHRALKCRHERLEGTVSDAAPILWQHGALARLSKGETIDKLLHGGYSTISLGYAGLWECVYALCGKKLTEAQGEELGLRILQKMNDACTGWKTAENIHYSLYGTPLESTTYKFAKALQRRFGKINGVTDKNYITNSYHVHVTEEIDAFEKLALESKFQALSPGGAISYVEVPNMQNNLDAVLSIMKFIYDNIMYAELNTKSDFCHTCGYEGEILIVKDEDGKLIWECPNCKNRDQEKMNVARRTCGYIGTQFWNQGRTQEIKERVMHL